MILFRPSTKLLLLLPVNPVEGDKVLPLAHVVGPQVDLESLVGAKLLGAPRAHEPVEVGAVDVLPWWEEATVSNRAGVRRNWGPAYLRRCMVLKPGNLQALEFLYLDWSCL